LYVPARRTEDGVAKAAIDSGCALRVVVVRHGIAEVPSTGNDCKPDAERALTRRGIRKMRKGARGMAVMLPALEAIASSPLTRAMETAEIISKAFKNSPITPLVSLAPGKPPGPVVDWLRQQPRGATVALVGHEPDVGQLVTWLLTGLRQSVIPMKKGGACLLEFSQEVKPGRAKLTWALRPGQLRRLR
jgi:phosphohistidine phosphatase